MSATPAGLFGKLASQGDFVTRRLPPAFVQAWDGWLQEGMRDMRARCGGAWLESYLHAPVWRFVLADGACGVLLPSVDRVGRHFPLTLASVATLPWVGSPFELAAGGAAWFDALSELALHAMCGELSVADLDLALLELGPPAPSPAGEHPGWIPLENALGACAALARALDPAGLAAKTLFWTDGTPALAPALLLSDGLPSTQSLGAMFGASQA